MTDALTNALNIVVAEPGPMRDAVYAIRRTVFVDEQGVAPELEYDELDSEAVHYLALIGGQAVGCARVYLRADGSAKIGRVAVLMERRGEGIGAALMRRTVEDASRSGAKSAVLHAQISASAFYERLGFFREGDDFMEADIPHCRMTRSLP